MLHTEIFSEQQRLLLPLVQEFRRDFGLVGGTALALHMGHRESIDFDLFTSEPLRHAFLRQRIVAYGKNIQTLVESPVEYTTLVDGVKVTFVQYPFPLTYPISLDETAVLPDILTLSAMKAYALGRRAKWKDYVDLYFVMEQHHSLKEIVQKAESIFGGEFNEKNFRSQLAYFQDIDYSEAVTYRPGYEQSDETLKKGLVRWSLS
ncbi:MAG: hypothetical protein E6Q53_02360 [Candidatus Moraniibacteriota bacterium]|nr:MAG: hypothetical protein E6Q53_02360 [Candidatus Moranbacteria bacterium]